MASKVGFFTDTSICIGCKACEVACKEWNGLQGNEPHLLLDSFDNTGQLDAENWRHVKFIEHMPASTNAVEQPVSIGGGQAWLMMSDVCKHCQHASCMDVCPTNAIVRTEFDTVYIQQELCYDRLQNDLMPACAKACPTQSISFGDVEQLHQLADARLLAVQKSGYTKAQLYGRDDKVYGGLNNFFLLMDEPEVYGLPNAANAVLPARNNLPGYLGGLVTAVVALVAGLVAFRRRGETPAPAEPTPPAEPAPSAEPR
jgi:formate dehydrogenase iron-sulfur subunit